jgi:hypothetical protein
MKAFTISQQKPFIPQLVQEIPDFKSWVLGCLKNGLEMLVGHIDMHLFRFIINLLGWLMMQYKVSPIDPIRSPIDGPPIRLWKVNPNGSPKLHAKVPSLVLYCPIWGNDASRSMEKKKFISFRLSKYVDFWKVSIVQSSTYEMKMKPYVEYWENILLHLSRPLPPQSTTILEDF